MKKIIATSFFLIFSLSIQAQKKGLKNSKSIEKFNKEKKENPKNVLEENIQNPDLIEIALEKANGFGPRGNSSVMIATKNKVDSLELSVLPKMKNIPTNLTDVVEYCYHLDRFQFYYQNYRNKVFPKKYFLREANRQQWNLKDTLLMTDKNHINTISVLAGFNSEGKPMYIVDSQNNGDFADDALKNVLSKSPDQDEVVKNSVNVDIEYFNGQSIKSEKILLFIGINIHYTKEKLPLFFSFPQFRHGRFKYKDKSYIIAAEPFSQKKSIYVLDDKPYFTSPGKNKEIEDYQYLELGGDYFQYIAKSQNSEKIRFQKILRPKENSLLVSNQLGMLAPNIEGLSILNNETISLKSLKGKYVFIDFWSTNCGPCIAEFPNIKEVYQKFNKNELEIIGVVDDRTGGEIKEFIQNKNLNWPNINKKTKSTNIEGYDINSYPTTYLIDPNGLIIATNLRGSELLNKLKSLNLKE